MECAEDDCERTAAVELHIPWAENRLVCAAHGRSFGQREGVVVEPLPDSDEHLLE